MPDVKLRAVIEASAAGLTHALDEANQAVNQAGKSWSGAFRDASGTMKLATESAKALGTAIKSAGELDPEALRELQPTLEAAQTALEAIDRSAGASARSLAELGAEAARLRIPVAEWDAFKRASSDAGISAERAAEMIRNLRHSLSGEGAEQARASLESLGVSLESLSSGRGVQQAFQAISRSLMDATDRSSAATASMRLLGASLEEVRNLSTSLGKATGGGLGSRPLATEADVNQAIKFGQALDNLTDQMARASNEMSRRAGAPGAFEADLRSVEELVSALDTLLQRGGSVEGLMRELGRDSATLSELAKPGTADYTESESRIRGMAAAMTVLAERAGMAKSQANELLGTFLELMRQGNNRVKLGALEGFESGGERAKSMERTADVLREYASAIRDMARSFREANNAADESGNRLADRARALMTPEQVKGLPDVNLLEVYAHKLEGLAEYGRKSAAGVSRAADAARDMAKAMAELDVRDSGVGGRMVAQAEAGLAAMADKARAAKSGAASLNEEIGRISFALERMNAGSLVREVKTAGDEAKKLGRVIETVSNRGVRIRVNASELKEARKRLEELKAAVAMAAKSGRGEAGFAPMLSRLEGGASRLESKLGEAERRFAGLEGRAHGFRQVMDGIALPFRVFKAETDKAASVSARIRRSWEAVKDAVRGASTEAARMAAVNSRNEQNRSFGKGFFSTAGHSAAMAFGIGSMAMLLTRVFRSIAEAGAKLAERLDSMAGRKGEAEAAKWSYEMQGRRDYEDRRKRRERQSDVLGRWIETRAREQEPGWEDSYEQMAERRALRTEAKLAGVEITTPAGFDLSLGELAGQAEKLKREEIRDLEKQAEDIREIERKIRATLEGSRENPTEAWRRAIDATVSVITEIKGGFQNLGADWDQQFSREERARLEEMARWADQRRDVEERAKTLKSGGETELQGRIRAATARGSDKAAQEGNARLERERQERIRRLNERAGAAEDPAEAAELRWEAREAEIDARSSELYRNARSARNAAVSAESGRAQRLLNGERERVEAVQIEHAPRYGRNEYAAGQVDYAGLFKKQNENYGWLEGAYRRAMEEYSRRLDGASDDEKLHLNSILEALEAALDAVANARHGGTSGDWAGRAKAVKAASDRVRQSQAAYGEFLGDREAGKVADAGKASIEADRAESRRKLDSDLDKAAEGSVLELERLEGELESANAGLERAMDDERRARREYVNVIREQARTEKRERLGQRRDRLQSQRDDIRRRLDRFGFRPYEGFRLDESARRRRRRRDNFRLDEGIAEKMARSERGERVHWTRRERERIGEYQRLERRDKSLEAAQRQIDAALKSMDAADRQRQAAAALERAAESIARAASGRAEAREDARAARVRRDGKKLEAESNGRYLDARKRLEYRGQVGQAGERRQRRLERAERLGMARNGRNPVLPSDMEKTAPKPARPAPNRAKPAARPARPAERSGPPVNVVPNAKALKLPAEWEVQPVEPEWDLGGAEALRRANEEVLAEQKQAVVPAQAPKPAEQKQIVRQVVVPAKTEKPKPVKQEVKQEVVPAKPQKPAKPAPKPAEQTGRTGRKSRAAQRREERMAAAERRRQRRVERTGSASLYNRPEKGGLTLAGSERKGSLKLAGQPRQGNLRLAGSDFLKSRRMPNLGNKAAAKGVDQSGLWQRLDLIHADLAKIAKKGATIV